MVGKIFYSSIRKSRFYGGADYRGRLADNLKSKVDIHLKATTVASQLLQEATIVASSPEPVNV